MRNASRAAAAAIIIVACTGCPNLGSQGGAASSSSLAEEEGYTIEASGAEQVGSQTCFSVTNSDTLSRFAWTVADAGGNPSANYPGCSDQGEVELCCFFQSTGDKTVSLSAADPNGEAVSMQTTVSVGLATGGGPAIIVDVRTTSGTLLGTYSQDPATAANTPIPSLQIGTTYEFDLSRTEANTGNSDAALTYQASFGQGWTAMTSAIASNRFPTSGYYPVEFQVTNSLGNTSTAQVELFVECANAAGYDFQLDPTKLTVTAGSAPNEYVYGFANIVVGGAGTPSQFSYLLDVNGDGIYDTPWTSLATPTHSGYSLYVSGTQYPTRPISLEVWDTQCNIVHSVTVPSTLPAPSAPSAASASFPGTALTGYDFIQGDVDSLPGSPPLAGLGLSFLGSEVIGGTTGNITCNYIRSGVDPNDSNVAGPNVTVSLSAQTRYVSSTNVTKPAESMELTINGITDLSGDPAATSPINYSAAALTAADYTTDSQSDIQEQYFFHNDQTCELTNFSVTPQGPPPTCDGSAASASQTYTAIVKGDFFCPHLINSFPVGVSAAIKLGDRGTGHFFCQIPVPNACIALHECVNGSWTDTGQPCCEDGSCNNNPPGPPAPPGGGGGGPGSSSGGSSGGGGGGSSSNPPPPPAPAPITPR